MLKKVNIFIYINNYTKRIFNKVFKKNVLNDIT